MDIINLIGEIAVAITKHGINATSLVIFIFALFKFAPFRRFVMRNLPRKLRMLDNRMDGMNVRMSRMERKLDAIARHMGVQEWDAHSQEVNRLQSKTVGPRNSSSPSWMASVRAFTIGGSTKLTGLLSHSKTREGNTAMKNKILSRKFLMALATGLLIVANDGLELGLDKDTILMVVSIIGGWIFVEGGTDIVKMKKEANYDYSGIDAERKSAEDSEAA